MLIFDFGIGQGTLSWAARSLEIQFFVDESSGTDIGLRLHAWTERSIVLTMSGLMATVYSNANVFLVPGAWVLTTV